MDNAKIVKNTTLSYLALRKGLGVMGVSLPLVIWLLNGCKLKSSISHFYYSNSSVVFTGYLIALGMFLICYPGRTDSDVKVSDNWITTIGGICAILTALVPTAFNSKFTGSLKYEIIIEAPKGIEELTTPIFHNESLWGGLHLFFAATFLVLMGYMSYSRFTKGNTSSKRIFFYRLCAFGVWIPLVAIALILSCEKYSTKYEVFIGECVSIFFFGFAWLVKGKTFDSVLKSIGN